MILLPFYEVIDIADNALSLYDLMFLFLLPALLVGSVQWLLQFLITQHSNWRVLAISVAFSIVFPYIGYLALSIFSSKIAVAPEDFAFWYTFLWACIGAAITGALTGATLFTVIAARARPGSWRLPIGAVVWGVGWSLGFVAVTPTDITLLLGWLSAWAVLGVCAGAVLALLIRDLFLQDYINER